MNPVASEKNGESESRLQMPDNVKKAIALLILVLILAVFTYRIIYLEEKLEEDTIKKDELGYVSDEIWYVCSSRNILYKIFHIEPWTPCGECYNIVFKVNNAPPKDVLEEISRKHNIAVLREVAETKDSSKYTIIYVKVMDKNSLERFIGEIEKKGYEIETYVRGWVYGKAFDIHKYLNLEHPPLVKYFIAFSILVGGDQPRQWRIPSMVSGVLILVLSYVITYLILRKRYGIYSYYLALLPPLFLTIDPVHEYMSILALLDIHVALFSLIALLVFICIKNDFTRAFSVALASLTKFSGLFIGLLHFIDKLFDERKRFIERVYDIIYTIGLYILLFMIIQIAFSIPFIVNIGFNQWFSQSIAGSFRWHTSVKCTHEGCPPYSSPIDWLLGLNSFVLYYWSNGEVVAAGGKPGLYLLSVLLAIILTPIALIDKHYRIAWGGLVAVYGGYLLLWILGGRTQYSFYLAHIAPFFYIHLAVAIAYLIDEKTYSLYKSFFKELVHTIRRPKEYDYERTMNILGYALILSSILLSMILHAPWNSSAIYTDIVSVYQTIYVSRENWYSSFMDYGIPYIDYAFPYLPGTALVFAITSLPKAFLGYDPQLHIDKGFYAYYILNSILILIATLVIYNDLLLLGRKLRTRIPLYIFALMPSIIVYGVYGWELIALALFIRGLRLLFFEDDVGRGATFITLSIMIQPIFITTVPLLLTRLKKGEKASLKFLAHMVLVSTLLLSWPLLNIDAFKQMMISHIVPPIEGSIWFILPYSQQYLIEMAYVVVTLIVLLILLLPLRVYDEFSELYFKITLTITLSLLFSPVYKPQFNTLVTILWIPIIEMFYLPLLVFQDLSSTMVILTWFSAENPLDKTSLPQIANYAKCMLLALIVLIHLIMYIDVDSVKAMVYSVFGKFRKCLAREGSL